MEKWRQRCAHRETNTPSNSAAILSAYKHADCEPKHSHRLPRVIFDAHKHSHGIAHRAAQQTTQQATHWATHWHADEENHLANTCTDSAENFQADVRTHECVANAATNRTAHNAHGTALAAAFGTAH